MAAHSRDVEGFAQIDSLREISSQFFEMVPVRKLKWKDEEAALLASSPELQRHLLLATVKNPVCQSCPPALSYMRYFMKLLIHKLESEDADICDEMYEAYTDILSRQEDEDETLCYKTYKMPSGESVSLQESVHLVSQGTTGLSTWQAAQHLAEWVIENPQVFSNRSVVELGSGLGLTGIVTCRLCQPQSFTFTDCHSQVLYLLSRNIERNLSQPTLSTDGEASSDRDRKNLKKIRRQLSLSSDHGGGGGAEIACGSDHSVVSRDRIVLRESCGSEDEICSDTVELDVNPSHWDMDATHRLASLNKDKRVNICHLDWECVKTKLLDKLKADIILAADVVYDTSIIPALVFVLKSLLDTGPDSNRKPKAFIASTIRNEDTRDEFLVAMGSEGLKYSVVESPKHCLFYYDRSVPIEILQVSAH
ncbi:protein-lysine N-methyltransferase EEF2KMT [Aplysia californica]|uniref:Protein-lysine N-methyltransferase EEF2KMT n=1 Tax=Aplysia californica TaxID=6500 RepID=A0ABM0ZZZ6_APLCA|nr:protein-lysine N-methyltransferase EEF2KMT [Aplysia californica]